MTDLKKDASRIDKMTEAVLGDQASALLMTRIQSTMDTRTSDLEALEQAVARLEKMIELCVGPREAQDVAQPARAIRGELRNQVEP